ncbi:polymer-forming cytoskeletal protein [Methanoculleus sp.]|uniref:polymer-forming cytoskeletal protein n=1 Tax=Methanoculleus sp. TaxID=90427 RepID=UPI0025E0B6B4|nr:polymer-forming cytoskeletal protein [Methanoculleus sp.]
MESTEDHDWIRACALPDRTELQERTLKTGQDIVIGERCRIDYGLSGNDVVICEFCKINGNIIATSDVRIDNWCEVSGDVVVEEDAYLGEGVKIQGKLVVGGDLDIGDNVQIERGFEAKGWISIRNPMPVIIYIVMYLVAVLGIEKEDELDSVLQKLFGDEERPGATPLMIPAGAVLNMQTFSVPERMAVGSGCRLHGNIRAGSIAVREETTIFGSLHAREGASVARGSVIHGDVQSDGDVAIEQEVHILGNVSCRSLTLHEDARVDGVIRAPGGLKIERRAA